VRDSVAAAFPAFSAKFEGRLPFMYLDVLGLVTTGVGVLIDPVVCSLSLPWVCPDGSPAGQADITADWQHVKARQDLRLHGGGAFRSVATLRLTDDAVDALTTAKMRLMEQHLIARFPQWESFPADAQLGILSVAWACGPAFQFPKFQAAILAQDWATCVTECQMNAAGNPGLVPRNTADAQLFTNASSGGDPCVLQYQV
jgi:GH24 family phage-related lysozyme (muramidase)